jgi:hypothetical protein
MSPGRARPASSACRSRPSAGSGRPLGSSRTWSTPSSCPPTRSSSTTNRRLTADLEVMRASASTAAPTGALAPRWRRVASRPASASLRPHPAGRRRRTRCRYPAAPHGDQGCGRGPIDRHPRPPNTTDPGAEPCRLAVRAWSCLPLGPTFGRQFRLQQRVHDPQPHGHAHGQQALPRGGSDLGHGHAQLVGQFRQRLDILTLHEAAAGTFFTAVPSIGPTWRSPDTYHTAGLRRGTATSTSTSPGTTSCGAQQGVPSRASAAARPALQLSAGAVARG